MFECLQDVPWISQLYLSFSFFAVGKSVLNVPPNLFHPLQGCITTVFKLWCFNPSMWEYLKVPAPNTVQEEFPQI
jgi:hypothetical protein